MDIRISCPLGSECEQVKDGYIERCAWYVKLAGETPDGKMIDEWQCAISWLPITTLETAKTNRGQTKALESMRNETCKRQDIFNDILITAATHKKLI